MSMQSGVTFTGTTVELRDARYHAITIAMRFYSGKGEGASIEPRDVSTVQTRGSLDVVA